MKLEDYSTNFDLHSFSLSDYSEGTNQLLYYLNNGHTHPELVEYADGQHSGEI